MNDDGWVLDVGPVAHDHLHRVKASLLALSNGFMSVIGDLGSEADSATRLVLVSGSYGAGADGLVRPLPGPVWTGLGDDFAGAGHCWALDLRDGVLTATPVGDGIGTVRFVSLVRPHLGCLRAERGGPTSWADPLSEPVAPATLRANDEWHAGTAGTDVWAETASDRATVAVTVRQRTWSSPDGDGLERIVDVRDGGDRDREDAEQALAEADAVGFDELLSEQRVAWQARWADADIEIGGDPDAQLAVRFALFHLLSCASTSGEAAVGARGLTGLAYAGHVFWDTDVFVLPALAATLPAAARAVLEYRIRRLPAARRTAAHLGLPGARFPWESAQEGVDVTPTSVRDIEGRIVPVRTGQHEEHINSDVAWAALRYVDWTGDTGVLEGPGRGLVTETAEYWAARVRTDAAGRGHLYGVIGPDEYHEVVDDNAYTNVMVRWHLRHAARLVAADGDEAGAARFRAVADSLVDGFDAATGRYEQFAGFSDLEPLLIADLAPPPVAADVLLGRERIRQTQVIKQPDVLMLHHLVPGECPEGSLAADVGYYLPRTAHGSSLSPAICAALLARAGRPDEALPLFVMAARLDLDDLTGMTAGGLHLATIGGLWQAVVSGFAGIEPTAAGLRIDPHLPSRWTSLRVTVRYRGTRVRVTIGDDGVTAEAADPVPVIIDGAPTIARRVDS